MAQNAELDIQSKNAMVAALEALKSSYVNQKIILHLLVDKGILSEKDVQYVQKLATSINSNVDNDPEISYLDSKINRLNSEIDQSLAEIQNANELQNVIHKMLTGQELTHNEKILMSMYSDPENISD